MTLTRRSVPGFVVIILLSGCANKVIVETQAERGGAAGDTAVEEEGGGGGEVSQAGGAAGKTSRVSGRGGTHAAYGSKAKGGSAATGGVTATGGTTSLSGTSSTEPAVCSGSPNGWTGCRGTGCSVCSELVANYPLYLIRHENCAALSTCDGQYYACSDNCPAPTDEDINGGTACEGASGGWVGCRSNGCLVCQDQLVAYPNYLKNHPNCGVNPACEGLYFACSSSCPAPTNADR